MCTRLRFSLGHLPEWGHHVVRSTWGFPGGSVVKNPSANSGDAGDAGSIPGLQSFLEKEMATHSSIFA